MRKDIKIGIIFDFIIIRVKIINEATGAIFIISKRGSNNICIKEIFFDMEAKIIPKISATKKPKNILETEFIIITQKSNKKINSDILLKVA